MLKEDKSEGFFRPIHTRARTELSDEEWTEFQSFVSPMDRVRWVFRLPALQGLNLQPFFQAKSAPEALRSKEEGNKEFSKGNTTRALHLYSQSILKQPSDTEEGRRSYAIALGNRSAALFRMSQWSLALSDIAQAFEAGFPPELRYKLLERRSRCLLQLGNLQPAKEAASQALQALPSSNMPPEKSDRWDADLHSLLCSIDKARQSEAAGAGGRPTSPMLLAGSLGSITPDPPNVTGGQNQFIPAASRMVQMKRSEDEGRFVVAAQPLRPGDTLLVERAFASVLMSDRGRTHCPRCFQGLVAPVPCKDCCNVIFCSPECCNEAMSSWHKYECKIQSLLVASGMSLTCYLALRMVTQTSFDTLYGMRSQLTKEPSETSGISKVYDSYSYATLYKLVSHEEHRSPEDLFHRCLMSAFLVRCLRLTSYFPDDTSNKEGAELTPNEAFIADMIVHFLQILQFNAHEIAEFQMVGKGHVDGAQSMRIGAGIYPTLAMFNHSCEPSIIRYFSRNTVVVRAVRNIAPGDVVGENYGPVYTQTPRRERQKRLLDQYWFVCKCRACLEDWPTFADMKGDSLRFRCTNPKCALPLGGSASADESPTEVVMKCKNCGRSTSMLKGLLALQKTEALFNNGVELLSQRKIEEAVPVFCRNLYLLDSILVPPYRDYHLCQEALRKCLLAAGNVRVASFSFSANGHKSP